MTPPPNIVWDVAAFLAAADRTPADYTAGQLANILHHDWRWVTLALFQLTHRRDDRPASWPTEWLA